MKRLRKWMRTSAALAAALALNVGAQPLPEDSVYQLQMPLRTQAGADAPLDVYRGHPVLISMFYASCGYVCPMLVHSLQRLDQGLDAPARAKLRVLLVSFDAERDTPEVLKETAAKHGVDTTRWTLASAAPEDVRKLAAVLGIRYRKLPDGGFNHATIVTLLDGDGRALARSERPAQPDAELIDALRKAAAATP
ncbi:MAG: SCO family protein [Pseudomonadota bacterium]